MARTSLTAQTPLGSYPATPLTANSADFTWAAGDAVNGNSVAHTGKQLVLVRNDNVGAQTVTFTSVVDSLNRLGTISAYSVGASEYAMFGPFKVEGWKQADGTLYIDVSHADVKVAVITIPD